MNLIVKDQLFRLEFRYITKLGKRAQLHRGAVQAVTTCVLIAGPPRFLGLPLIAIDNALCADGDNFSRRAGRSLAFKKLLEHCGALREFREDLWLQFHRVFSGIEDCPTCKGKGRVGYVTQSGGSITRGCPDCANVRIVDGTGLKGGQLLAVRVGEDVALLNPEPKPKPRKPKPEPEAIAALIAAGSEKRRARQLSRGAA